MFRKKLCDYLSLKGLTDGSKNEAIWLWLALSVWLPYVLTGVILVAVFLVIVLSPELREKLLREKRMLIISSAIGALSFVSSATALNVIGMLVSFGIFIILLCGCYLRSTVQKELFDKCSAILAFGSIAALISAVLQRMYYGNNEYRPTAGAFNANYYGALIVFTLIMAAVHFIEKPVAIEEKTTWYHLPRWFWLLTFGIDIVALLYCRSRSSLLAFSVCTFLYLLISGVFYLLNKRYRQFGLRLFLALLCGVGFGGIWLLGYRYPDLFNWTNSLTFIFTERVEIWKNAWRSYTGSARSILIGRGPMTYYFVKDSEGLFSAHHAHNILFDTLLNVGAIGVLLYILLLADMLKAAFKGLRAGGIEWLISVTVVVEILVQGVADVTIMWLQTGIMFFLVAFPTLEDEN